MEDNQIQEQWNIYKELLLSTKRPNIEKLIQWLDESDFKYAPASTQYHNSFRGGLLQHSLNVYYAMYDFKPWLDFFELEDDTIKITALLHDICKVYCYDVSTRNTKVDGNWVTVPYYSWNEQEPLGHGSKSVMLINEYGVQLTKTERAMILNHMGFSADDNDERRISKLFRICPQSLVLHCADLEATMIIESFDGPQRYIDKLKGNNITESLSMLQDDNNQTINILGTEYKLAPQNSIVDDEKIIEVPFEGKKIKVYSPYGDGLPF